MDMLNDREAMNMLDQIVARTRRIETRLTSYLVANGYHTSIPPKWVGADSGIGYIAAPLDTTLGACLNVVPEGYVGEVNVIHNGTIVAVVNV